MRLRLFPVLVLFVVACGDSESESVDADQTQRTSMRSEIEGQWTGAYTPDDGRAATTMTLDLRYSGTGRTVPQCGNRTLGTGVQPTCITLYSLPLSGSISTADGARANEPVTLTYGNLDGLAGNVSAGKLEAILKSGKLEGKVTGTNAGSFSLSHAPGE